MRPASFCRANFQVRLETKNTAPPALQKPAALATRSIGSGGVPPACRCAQGTCWSSNQNASTFPLAERVTTTVYDLPASSVIAGVLYNVVLLSFDLMSSMPVHGAIDL